MPLPSIHVIGDSHSRLFTQLPGCIVHHIGPRTMYGLRNGLIIGELTRYGYHLKGDPLPEETRIPLDVRSFGVQAGQYVVYVFGEIDVRTHIGRIRDKTGQGLDEILDDLVKYYIDLIVTNQQESQCLSIIAAIVPPSNIIENPDFPFYGSLEDRIMIQQQLNTKLKLACQQHNLLYLDCNSNFTNPDGTLCYDMSDGHVHLHPKCNIIVGQELYRLILRRKTG